jgi:membrane-associated phospholipid phosphatase
MTQKNPTDSESATIGSAAEDLTVPQATALSRARWAEIVFVSSLGLYTILAILAHQYAYFGWDVRLADLVQSIGAPAFNRLMVAVSALGTGWTAVGLVLSVGFGLILARFRVEGIICMVGVGLGSVVNVLLKELIGRPRPVEPLVNVTGIFHHESFPSGHVTFVLEFFGFVFFLAFVLLKRGYLRTAVLILLGIQISLIGVSRVYLGAHWPSDVAGAYLFGGVWLMLMIEAYRQLKARSRHTAANEHK